MTLVDLPDVNVWIALSAPGHVMRPLAEAYWHKEAAPRVAFSAVTMLGLVRVITNAPLFGGHAVAPSDAWGVLQGWLAMEQVTYVHEPEGCRAAVDRIVAEGLVTARTWTDAYLAAFAEAAGARLVSMDGDMLRYPGLNLLHLTA